MERLPSLALWALAVACAMWAFASGTDGWGLSSAMVLVRAFGCCVAAWALWEVGLTRRVALGIGVVAIAIGDIVPFATAQLEFRNVMGGIMELVETAGSLWLAWTAVRILRGNGTVPMLRVGIALHTATAAWWTAYDVATGFSAWMPGNVLAVPAGAALVALLRPGFGFAFDDVPPMQQPSGAAA